MTPIRVAICDDSRTYSHALKRFLERDPDLQVVGVHGSAEDLLRNLPSDRPDLVTMDLELPGLDGVQATERIMRSRTPVPVVVLSAHVSPGSARAAAALGSGAVDAVLKSELPLAEADGRNARTMRLRFKRLSRARVQTTRPDAPAPPHPRPPGHSRRPKAPVRAIGIAASTGGPQALALVLGALPAGFPIPILVVQHMAVGFTAGLASWLDRQCALPVRLGTPGTEAGPGIWFAPDSAHMTIDESLRIRQDRRTVAGRHKPAADVLFRSMAGSLGSAAAAVVLTGLGRDGAAGVEALVGAGAFVIAQDEATSVVNGMPGAAVKAGANLVLPVEDMASMLQSLPAARA